MKYASKVEKNEAIFYKNLMGATSWRNIDGIDLGHAQRKGMKQGSTLMKDDEAEGGTMVEERVTHNSLCRCDSFQGDRESPNSREAMCCVGRACNALHKRKEVMEYRTREETLQVSEGFRKNERELEPRISDKAKTPVTG